MLKYSLYASEFFNVKNTDQTVKLCTQKDSYYKEILNISLKNQDANIITFLTFI